VIHRADSIGVGDMQPVRPVLILRTLPAVLPAGSSAQGQEHQEEQSPENSKIPLPGKGRPQGGLWFACFANFF
jgi:hypothetical protein